MSLFPRLEIYPRRIRQNAAILRGLCLRHGIEPVAVIKGFQALPAITQAIMDAGYTCLASSYLPHLKAARQLNPQIKTMMLRLPMLSEIGELVETADISLNSEYETLCRIDAAARARGKQHQAILMRDLGDLREGVIDGEQFVALACRVEQELPQVHLLGVGVNLSCYGGVMPTAENLGQLAAEAREIESRISRPLEIISGGSTSSLPLLAHGGMPPGVNQLRLGEALVVPCDLIDYWRCPLPGLSNEGLIFRAEIIEAGAKPSRPIGRMARDAFGNQRQFEDQGQRKRLLLAAGVFQAGDEQKLIPCDAGAKILGASSDHMIVDITDSCLDYRLGDSMAFQLHYKAMLFLTANPLVHIAVIDED